jgi:phosphotransferase system HPr (HPr) family protein
MSASSDSIAVTSVVLPADLHARPAGQVSQLAAGFDAEVELVAGARTARAASVLAVMGLGARAGQQIEVRASGPDAAEAASAVAAVLGAAEPVAG